jgi:O-antigen ligase
MLDFIKTNARLVIMLMVWVFFGMIQADLAALVVAATVVLLKKKEMYKELVIGFLFVLIMSDNRQSFASFAIGAKNLYIVLMAAFYFLDRKSFAFRNDYFKPFIPFFLFGAIALSQAPMVNFSNSAMKTLSYVLLLMVTPAYFIKCFRIYGPQFLKDVIFFYGCIFLIGVILIPVAPDIVFLVGRYSGIYGNPNGIGIASTVLFLLIFITNKKFPGLLSSNELRLMYLLIVLAILLSVSRNTMVSLMLFLLFARFYEMSLLAGFAILVAAVMAFELINNNIVAIVTALGLGKYLRAEAIEDGSGRALAWHVAWKQIQHQFYLGGGFAYDEWFFYENRHWLMRKGHQGGVHNSWLALWMNTGIIGLLLFAVGLFKTFGKALARTRLSFPIMFAVLFSASFEAWLMGSLNPFHVVFVLLMTVILNDDQFSEDIEKESPVLIS